MHETAPKLMVLITGLVACGGGQGEIEFAIEREFLPDFELDTGFLPEGQPVQVRAIARAGGTLSARAAAERAGDELVPVPGSGSLALSAGLSLEIHANIDVTGASFNGLVESFEYAIPETEIAFEPFLLDAAATLDVPLPAEELATVPIGSVPGASLRISVEGGNVTVGLAGDCAAASNDLAQFTGTLTTGGRVELGATVVLDLPIGGTKEFGPFTLPVDLPALDIAVDFGTFGAGGAKSDAVGPCAAGGGSGGGDDGDNAGDGDNSDTGGDGGDGSAGCALLERIEGSGVVRSFSGVTDGSSVIQVGGSIGPDDVIAVTLYNNRGVFAEGYRTGVFSLRGDDTDGALCAACVVIGADPNGDEFEHLLMAESGTLTIGEIEPEVGGRVSGTLGNVVLREVTFDNNVQVEVEDGCRTTVESLSFVSTLESF